MKNRDKYILKRNEYDLLITIQTNIIDNGGCCVIDEITGNMNACPEDMKGKVGRESKLAICSKCIQAWLNEEA